jgi:tRNA(Ile)-lysidine synthase
MSSEEIYLNVYKRITNKEIFQNNFLISYSGGKDSSVLLDFFLFLYQRNLTTKPFVFHMDHKIRDTSIEVNQIKIFLNSLDLESFIVSRNIPKLSSKINKSIEETGRLLRYKYLQKISKKKNDSFIVTGHHVQDYLESVLIHLIRGAGISALSTLSPLNQKIFRPLVYFKEDELKKAQESLHFKIFEDSTNLEMIYTRNRIRHTLIKSLKNEGIDLFKMYWNFHENQLLIDSRKLIYSYLMIPHGTIFYSNLSELKMILDTHLKILKLHPIKTTILKTIKNALENSNTINIRTNECIFWKSKTSDFYLIPASSPTLQLPKIKDNSLVWNKKKILLKSSYELGFFSKITKIFDGKIHRSIGEILRIHSIPVPIRSFIPILLENGVPKKIVLSLWNEKLNDYPNQTKED